jgi:hypothetical protein
VYWESFVVHDLVELIHRLFCFLTAWGAIHSANSVVRLTLARRIPLVTRPSTIIVTLPIFVLLWRGK